MKPNYRKFLIMGMLSFFAGNMIAGQLERGIEFNNAKMYETSKVYLLQGIQQQGATAEAYYYLGDTYLMLNKEDSASFYFKKSLEMNPEYALPLVGEGKILLKQQNKAGADEMFTQAAKKEKKNPAVYTAIAAAYVEYNFFDSAPAMYEKAREVKKNYPNSFIVEGDMLAKQGKAGEACNKYPNASYFDPKNKLAYLQEARVYKHINTTRALEILDNLISIDADYIPAYVEYSDIYYDLRYFKKALPVYEKFINEPGIGQKQIENYAAVLYFSGDFVNALTQIMSALDKNPNSFIMKRLQFYCNSELNNDQVALGLGEKFFASKGEKDEYISQDYSLFAKMLTKKKQDLEAINYYKKAIELDSAKNTELYKDISSAYEKTENFPEAIAYFQKYMDALETPNTSDYYMFGRSYYMAGGQMGAKGDTTMQKFYLQKADSLFGEVIKQNPDHYLGYLWKGNALAALDPELTQGLAKPWYEQAVEKMLPVNEDGKRNRDITNCYKYLGNYYYINKNKDKAIEYFNKILELTPNNQELIKIIEDLKKS